MSDAQFDIPPAVLALVREPDEVWATYDRTLLRYWDTKLGYLQIAAYNGSEAVMIFGCSAQCANSCCAPGARTLAQIREMFCDPSWRERHGMEPKAPVTEHDRIWEIVRESARGE